MRDISQKSATLRTATATATVLVSQSTVRLLKKDKLPKGNPLPVAKVAAILAAKNTSQIIPYCHPLPVDFVECTFLVSKNSIQIKTTVKATYKTGVEMEALAAATVAALTVYDMLKIVDTRMEIKDIRLIRKTGGKSDIRKPAPGKVAAVVVISDSVSGRRAKDMSGSLIVEALKEEGFRVRPKLVIPDEQNLIEKALVRYADAKSIDLVITTGGTGLSRRDVTPQATARIIERDASGIVEALRAYGQTRTPFAMLSRGVAGVRGKTLFVNLPGSPRSVRESLTHLFPVLHHAFEMIAGGGHGPRKGKTRR